MIVKYGKNEQMAYRRIKSPIRHFLLFSENLSQRLFKRFIARLIVVNESVRNDAAYTR